MRRKNPRELARQVGPSVTRVRNLVRRLAIKTHDAVSWALEGFRDERGRVETVQAEIFSGIGIAARPGETGAPEAIVLSVNGQVNHRVIVATRDRTAEKAAINAAGGLGPGELLIYTDKAQVKLTADGEILAGKLGGPFRAVALDDHRHTVGPLVVQFPQQVALVPNTPPMSYPVSVGVVGGEITTSEGDSNSREVKVS